MLRKALILGALTVFVFLVSGCGTLFKGTGGLAQGFSQGVKEGAKEDWAWIKKADSWMKDNLW